MNDNITLSALETLPVLVPIRQAAELTGLSYECIRHLCIEGKIVFFRSGAKYLVNFRKLLEYLNEGGAI